MPSLTSAMNWRWLPMKLSFIQNCRCCCVLCAQRKSYVSSVNISQKDPSKLQLYRGSSVWQSYPATGILGVFFLCIEEKVGIMASEKGCYKCNKVSEIQKRKKEKGWEEKEMVETEDKESEWRGERTSKVIPNLINTQKHSLPFCPAHLNAHITHTGAKRLSCMHLCSSCSSPACCLWALQNHSKHPGQKVVNAPSVWCRQCHVGSL